MDVILYRFDRQPESLSSIGFAVNAQSGQIIQNQALAAELMGCAPELVDVLACGVSYLVYSVFDYEGPANLGAMRAVAEVTGVAFQFENEDELLCGPVLIVVD